MKFKKIVELMHKNEFETTYCVFQTVYKIAKKQRPFCDLPDDIHMQILNGINMGRVLHSDKSCADIATHITDEIKKKTAEDIVTNKRHIHVDK
jgi:hypothetical protein